MHYMQNYFLMGIMKLEFVKFLEKVLVIALR